MHAPRLLTLSSARLPHQYPPCTPLTRRSAAHLAPQHGCLGPVHLQLSAVPGWSSPTECRGVHPSGASMHTAAHLALQDGSPHALRLLGLQLSQAQAGGTGLQILALPLTLLAVQLQLLHVGQHWLQQYSTNVLNEVVPRLSSRAVLATSSNQLSADRSGSIRTPTGTFTTAHRGLEQ